jgi:hypothetical protein
MRINRRNSSNIRMMWHLLFLALLSVTGTAASMAQESNLQRLQQCARIISDSLLLSYGGGDTLCLTVVPHPASWLVDQATLQQSEQRKIHIGSCAGNSPETLSMVVNSIGIEYRTIDDPDSVERISRLSLSASLPTSTASGGTSFGRVARTWSVALSDTVEAARTSSLETAGYEFTRGTLLSPDHPGFWGKIVEPAVVIGASVVMVILFFSVRSQ